MLRHDTPALGIKAAISAGKKPDWTALSKAAQTSTRTLVRRNHTRQRPLPPIRNEFGIAAADNRITADACFPKASIGNLARIQPSMKFKRGNTGGISLPDRWSSQNY